MPENPRRLLAIGFAAASLALYAPHAAQSAGRIVCWKDASGKVIGCGDTVPPEYRSSATKELDSRGMTRKTTESAEDAAKRREEEQALAKKKADEEQRLADQKRLDSTLINTFNSPQEIDAKRDRELQTIDLQLKQSQTLLQGVTARYAETKGRVEALEKQKKPVPSALKEDYQRVAEEKQRYEEAIAARKKDRDGIVKQYADYKARYIELRGSTPVPPKK